MNKKLIALLVYLASTLSLSVFAKGVKYEEKWGMAGCGFWNYAIDNKETGAQLGVWALRNFIFYDSATSAITSGTSNCVDRRMKMAAHDQR